ncbi:MAG TPA: hypothetical protein VK762_07775 [Polyangiaceae bacterium]|nr:hypothetical protein [Polyangiaceae bacterium]
MTTAPTWTQIYTDYLKSGTPGNCVNCHFQMSSASGAYSYLKGQGYINGTGSILAKTGSCLSWLGGTMPPGGPRSEPMAVSDMNAWAAAGAKNN